MMSKTYRISKDGLSAEALIVLARLIDEGVLVEVSGDE